MLVPLLLAFQSLVEGETCPAAVDIEARVRSILHLSAEQELSEGYVAERHESGLYVELRSADGALIGQRTLPAQGSCDELAQAAAVVLSAWLSDVHPDFAGVLPDRAPEPEPEPPAPPPPMSTATAKPVTPAAPTAAPPAVKRRSDRRWELALGLGADITGAKVTVALPVGVGYVPTAVGVDFGVGALSILTPSRQEQLGQGQVHWRRWPLGAGPVLRVVTGRRAAWDLSIGPALAWLHVAGTNFDHISQRDGVAWGAFANGSVSVRGRHWGLLGLVSAQYYPGVSDVYVSGGPGSWALPHLSLVLALGVDFTF